MSDYYKVLGIDPSSTSDDVKKAYFEMAKKYHPDSGDETEIEKFHEVAEAYKVLSEEDSRKAYDTTINVEESKAKSTVSDQQAVSTGHRGAHRDDDLKTFHKNRFNKAIFRVIGFTLLIGLGGYIVAVILGGTGFSGGFAGLLIGFSLSINKNFNLSSFFSSDKIHRAFRFSTWLLLLFGFGYFVWLIARDLIPL